VDLLLDPDASAGRREGLEQALREAIRSGRLAPGTRLPSTRALAGELGVARGTVVEAYGQLAAEGWLLTRQGASTTVARLPTAASPPPPAAGSGGPAVDLRPGEPDPGGFPRGAWLAALRRVLATAPPEVLGYGDPRGRPELRTALAGYLTRARGVAADPGRIVVTSGFADGLARLAVVLRDQGADTIAMEDPGQPLHRRIAAGEGLRVVPAPVDRDGLVVGELDHVGAALVTPAHQFPLGVPLEWAARVGAIVVEDDYDGEFRYDRKPIGALQGLDPERVVYAGTASKTLAPATRLAWMVVPARLMEPLVEDRRHRVTAPALDQLVLAELLSSGAFDRHVRRMRSAYRRRRDALVAALAAEAPGHPVSGLAAGLHALVGLPRGATEAAVAARAAEAGVALELLGPHWHGAPRHEGLLVGYGRPPAHAFRAALQALVAVLTGEKP
jgi:GntR family transcriptional regulator/MocR family aminotransferase